MWKIIPIPHSNLKHLFAVFSGAFNITKEAQIRSQEAQAIVDGTKDTIDDSENVRSRVEKMLEENEEEFNRKLSENQDDLDDLNEEVTELSDKITDINMMVSIVVSAPGNEGQQG